MPLGLHQFRKANLSSSLVTAIAVTIMVAVVVSFITATTGVSLLEIPSAVLRLMAPLTVLSNLFVKIFFGLVDAFFAVAPLVCP
jgi:hypothetical protein